jgi:hypothetical protein
MSPALYQAPLRPEMKKQKGKNEPVGPDCNDHGSWGSAHRWRAAIGGPPMAIKNHYLLRSLMELVFGEPRVFPMTKTVARRKTFCNSPGSA